MSCRWQSPSRGRPSRACTGGHAGQNAWGFYINVPFFWSVPCFRATERLPRWCLHLMAGLQVIESVTGAAEQHAQVAMLAKTHGQPASPTTMGKELAIFAYRLQRQRSQVLRTCLICLLGAAADGSHKEAHLWVALSTWHALHPGTLCSRDQRPPYFSLTHQAPHHMVVQHTVSLPVRDHCGAWQKPRMPHPSPVFLRVQTLNPKPQALKPKPSRP